MTRSFQEHCHLAQQALAAKKGRMKVSALGRRAAVFYGHLTVAELEELAAIGASRS